MWDLVDGDLDGPGRDFEWDRGIERIGRVGRIERRLRRFERNRRLLDERRRRK
jgi:hypothetical protein